MLGQLHHLVDEVRCLRLNNNVLSANDERGHLPFEFIRTRYSQKMRFLEGRKLGDMLLDNHRDAPFPTLAAYESIAAS